MWLIRKIRYKYNNASDRAQHELKVLLVLLCAALLINIPALLKNIKVYSEWKQSSASDTEWKVTPPEQQGMDESILKSADKFMEKTPAGSLIVVRHGAIAYERYYNSMNEDYYNNVYSVTKSFISALTGIAIDKGLIGGTDDKLSEYFPEYCKKADPSFGRITIENLLTMTPGFCEELNSWLKEENWVEAVFNLPLKYKPGEKFQYANSATHLLSGILTKAAGMSTYDFAEENLFQPLGITRKKWAADHQGIYTGYANLYLRPRDMAKFGQLYLNGGKWGGKQVVPEDWVKLSTEAHYKFESTESDSDKGSSDELDRGYGYKWWVSEVSGYMTYSAIGYGGQCITVIPGLDIVMVVTTKTDTPLGANWDQRLELLKNYVIPSVKR